MREILLSASVPTPNSKYYSTADPYLIQVAIRELLTLTIGRRRIIWGGHPSITPMIYSICDDLDVKFQDTIMLYQSNYFKDEFPKENETIDNIVFTENVHDNLSFSLELMRSQMIQRKSIEAAVFIGGMDGLWVEADMFLSFHPKKPLLSLWSPGGAAREIAELYHMSSLYSRTVDFASLFVNALEISPAEERTYG